MKTLLELEAKYREKANKIIMSAFGDHAVDKLDTAKSYIRSADSVRLLIEQ